MVRATTKKDLERMSEEKFDQLFQLVATLTVEEQEAAFHFDEVFLEKKKEAHWRRDKNLRDLLIHLYEWHQLLIQWIESNREGKRTSFLPKEYNWRTYGALNKMFVIQHQNTTLSEAKALIKNSHQDVMALISQFTNDELFTQQYFPWTGSSSLGSYCVSSTASHYDWAIKKIKHYQRMLNKAK